jgi:hypothetical protein
MQLQSETALNAAAEVVDSSVKSPFTWLSALKHVKPETLLMVVVLYILVKPELTGFCIGG